MHHPTQANYLSTSFVAEVERAKTQEGVKSNRRFKRKQKAASDIAKQRRKNYQTLHKQKTVRMLCTEQHLIFLLAQPIHLIVLNASTVNHNTVQTCVRHTSTSCLKNLGLQLLLQIPHYSKVRLVVGQPRIKLSRPGIHSIS